MKVFVLSIILLVFTSPAHSNVDCKGKINGVYKLSGATSLSVRVKLDVGGQTHWIQMPTESDESMALTAFAAQVPVHFHWNVSTITSCTYGASETDRKKSEG